MILKPYSFNGTSLQDTATYVASFPRAMANLQMQTNPSYVRRAGAVPVYAGKDFQPMMITLEILCGGTFTQTFETLNTLFDTKDETPRQLICQDVDYASSSDYVQYYVYATAKQVQGGHDGNMAVVTLALDDPIWQSVTQNSQTWSITSSTSTTDVSNGGNDYAFPIFEITPTSQPSTDYLYNMHCQVLPQSTDPYPSRYLDITGATDTTWDTAALVAGGKMQSAGQDIRVLRDGVFVDYWLDGINTTDTHVIVVADMPARQDMTLKTAIASTDTITEIELNYTLTNKTKITACPAAGRLILDSSIGSTDTEEFTYTAKTITPTKLAFTINARSVRNTSAFSFSANANVRFQPYDFTILYGNSTASAYETDDTRKPLEALTSRNSSLSYTSFFDSAGLRQGGWQQSIRRVSNTSLSRSDFYTSTNDEGDTDPATAMGVAAYTYQAGGAWRSDTIQIGWLNYFPDIIASVSASGEQYQTSASTPTFVLQSGRVSNAFSNLWSISSQASSDYSTWTTWSKASSDATIPASSKYLRWYGYGSVNSTTDNNSRAAMTAITVGLTNYPHVMLRTEGANYKLDCTIGNSTTGESIRVIYPMALNETLYVDTDPSFPYAKHKGLMVNGAVSLSSIRAAWLKLNPGSNTLTFDSNLAATSNVTIIIKWRDRANFM